jgi:hypothetical protein
MDKMERYRSHCEQAVNTELDDWRASDKSTTTVRSIEMYGGSHPATNTEFRKRIPSRFALAICIYTTIEPVNGTVRTRSIGGLIYAKFESKFPGKGNALTGSSPWATAATSCAGFGGGRCCCRGPSGIGHIRRLGLGSCR